ncbi:hypothetical protein R5R35_007915 [Gryllus longicercus]|uniref:tRNA (32-2'-O)-methyltransferase regulator THADA n=1 Tax=Gryllus longicercus TaxID=2509291 RepID=A0AAN9V4D4_9ORTH
MTKSTRNDPSKTLTSTKERKRANVVRVSTDCVEKLVSSVVDVALQDDIIKFCSLSSVEEQLKLIKCMCGSYLKTTESQESYRAFVKFTVEIYLCSESKNPIKSAVPRLLTSAPASLHSDIVKTLSECFAGMLASAQNEFDSVASPTTNAMDIVVSNVVIIASNFILGTQAIMIHFKSFLMFLVRSLEVYLGALKTERAASVREDLHRKVHNAARAILLLLQCCHNGKGKFVCSPDSDLIQTTTGGLTNVLEEVGPLLQHALCQLLMQEELPLDVRNTCALTLISYCTLLTSKSWRQLVFLAGGQDVPGCFPAILGTTELARLSLCVGLLGSLPVADLAAPIGCLPVEKSPLRMILESLLVLANKKPSQPILELGTARAIGQILRVVSSVISVNEVGSQFRSLGLHEGQISDGYPDEDASGDGTEDASVTDAVRALFLDTGPSVLPVLWMQVEHSMDAVRHTARGAIQSFVSIAEALESKGEPRPAAALRASLAELASFRRARYLALAAAAAAGGGRAAFAGALAEAAGATPAALMAAAAGGDAAVRPHAAAAFEALQAAEAPPASAAADAQQRWLRRWVRPLLEGLTAAGDAAPPPELEGLVAKAVARFPSGVAALALETSASAGGGDAQPLAPARLRTLLLCLCAARRHGAFDDAEDHGDEDDVDDVDVAGSWKGVLSYELLLRCAAHASDEVRLGALALAAEAHRSTEAPSRGELRVARAALAHLAATQAPATRQRTAALLQRLLQRLRASASGAARRRQRRPAALARAAAAFLRWLHAFALASLFPGANFGRRTFALWVLRLMTEELGDEAPPELWETCNVPLLLEALRDPYENNKSCALLLLRRFPTKVLHVQDKSFTVLVMGTCLALARSIRPADTVTAAYLLRFLVSFPEEEAVWASIEWMEQQYMLPATDQVNIGNKTALHCRTIKAFTSLLTRQVNVAKTNIMAAVVEGPMYGILLCLRLLLEDCDLQLVADEAEWHVTFTRLIDVCYAAVAAVELVVNSASPEGHLPMDAQLFTDLQRNNAESMNLISPSCANVTAQQVLLCSWRTVKETSLLLGCLAARAPIRETSEAGDKGLIGEEQIFVMGQHFLRLLAEVKHRGAFEQVYVGFTQLCSKLWSLGKKTLQHDSGDNVALHELPANWLNELLKMVSSAGDSYIGTALCVTRRSAGVPFLVQALLATEPSSVTGETSVFPRCMEKLLHLAEGNGSVEACTHALNILRAVFRSSILVERTAPYLANAVKVAVHGCHVDTWSVRNSATLLFSVLVTRLFGVPSVRDRHRLKRMTGRLFFHQHPTLYDFLLAELTPSQTAFPNSASSAPSPDSFEPFPALLVLSRLYPSALEGMDSNLQLSRFIPLVSACANCSSERIRALAARALAPLVAPTAWPSLLMSLLETAAASDFGTWNMRRGLLLQVVSLLQTFSTHLAQDISLQNKISTWLNSSEWLLVLPQHKTASFPVAEAYIQVLQGLANAILGQIVIGCNKPENDITDVYEENSVSLKEVERNDSTKINPEIKTRWMRVQSIVRNIIEEFQSSISSFIPETGRCLYEMRATQLLLTLTRTLVPSELPSLLSDLVLCHSSEIAHISLCFVLHTFKHIPLRLPFEEEYDDEEELPSDDAVEKTLKESSSLSHSIARLLLLPEDQLLPDCRLCCFQLLQHLPLIVPWLIQLLPSSLLSEENDASDSGKQLRSYRGEITQWLLKECDTDPDRVGPSIVASFSVLFSEPKGFCGNNDFDVSLNANDLLNLSITIETASSPEYSVELRYAIACLVTSPSVSQYLLHPLKKKVTNPLAICHLWSAVVLLLDDDNPEVRQQAATLVLQLPESGNLPMMEAKAREILVPTFVKTVTRISPLLTAATLTMWILHNFNVTFNKEFDSLEEQVFEQSEANDFEEPALLAKLASSALCLLITENPNLANSLLPPEVYSWLITQCWDEFVSQEGESMSLQAVAWLAEKQLLAMGVEVRPVDCTSFAALKQSLHVPARTRLAALRLQLLQKALGLPMAALKPSSS